MPPHRGGGAHACGKEGIDGSHLSDKLPPNKKRELFGTEEILSAQTTEKGPALLLLGGPLAKAAKSNLSKYCYLNYRSGG